MIVDAQEEGHGAELLVLQELLGILREEDAINCAGGKTLQDKAKVVESGGGVHQLD